MSNQEQIEKNEIEGSLLLRYVRGATTVEENQYIEQWLQEDPRNEKTVEQIARIYYAQRTQERISRRDSHLAFRRVKEKQQRKKRSLFIRRLSVAAACVALVVSLLSNIFLFNNRTTFVAESQYITVETNTGMRSSLYLPDGTLVHLNSGSKFTYPVPYDPQERRVTLDGEGYFEVSHNPDQPFIVSVADDRMRVKVLGTRFNINAYSIKDEIYTTLADGSVAMQFVDIAKKRVIGEQLLEPTEKATYNPETNKLLLQKVNPLHEYAWKEGKLIFKDTPMPEVLHKTSTFYNVKFEIEDPVINTYLFTGTFEERQLSQLLHYIEISSQINSRIISPTEDDSQGVKQTRVILSKKK